jgi:hypothetical protein
MLQEQTRKAKPTECQQDTMSSANEEQAEGGDKCQRDTMMLRSNKGKPQALTECQQDASTANEEKAGGVDKCQRDTVLSGVASRRRRSQMVSRESC